MSSPHTESLALAVRELALIPAGEELSVIDRFSLAVDAYIAETAAALESAKSFEVTSEIEFQFNDQIQDDLKRRIKEWETQRSPITKPLNDLVSLLVAKDGNGNLKQAVAIRQGLNSAYRRKIQDESARAQREADRLLREQRERQEAEARRLEEHALSLKTAKAQEAARQKAEEIRQVAAMMPETVALSAPEPQTAASNVAQVWNGKITSVVKFLGWLILHPEWISVIDFKQAELNRLAKQFTTTIEIPGFDAFQVDSFRSKARR